jgi:hypothetical protein
MRRIVETRLGLVKLMRDQARPAITCVRQASRVGGDERDVTVGSSRGEVIVRAEATTESSQRRARTGSAATAAMMTRAGA